MLPASITTAHTALTAIVTGLLAVPLAYRLLRPRSWSDVAAIAFVTAASVFLWRKSANMGQLNDDGAQPAQRQQLAGPVLTYVFLGI